MFRVVLDTNVLISAIVFGGNPRILLSKVIEESLEMGLSDDMLDEIKDVLWRPKFGLKRSECRAIIQELERLAVWVFPEDSIIQIEDDPDDNRVLECAMAFDANFIISGDEHLLALKKFQKIDILAPAEFIKVYG